MALPPKKTDEFGLQMVSFRSAARYTLLEEIGRGGMGIVYLAEKQCAEVSDLVALKTIRTASPEHADILMREAHLATQLRHENIVKTYGLELLPIQALPPEIRATFQVAPDREKSVSESTENAPVTPAPDATGAVSRLRRTGLSRRRRIAALKREEQGTEFQPEEPDAPRSTEASDDDMLLIAMDYIEGTDMLRLHNEHLKAGYLMPPILIAFMISRVCRALAYAHNFVVHRDISPENVLINNQGVCKLTDFGIAVAAKAGKIKWGGKLGYMAPEQFQGKVLDERADIYSLGLVAYLLTTGIPLQAPAKRGTLKERMLSVKRQMDEGFPPPHQVMNDVPREFSDIIMRMIAPNPDDRFGRASRVSSELEHKYLYAKGFGPTNNSLAAYIDIFDSGFTKYDEDQLEQLSFLRGPSGGMMLKRRLSLSNYTRCGRKIVADREQYYIYRRLAALEHERAQKTSVQGRPVLKVRVLENVVETYSVNQAATIGSSKDCTIWIPGEGVAAEHVRLIPEVPVRLVATEGNKLQFNNQPVDEVSLQEGDRFSIGSSRLYFLHDPVLSPPKTSFQVTDTAPPLELISEVNFQLCLRPSSSEVLFDFWHELAVQTGLGDQKCFLLASSMVESVGLIADEDLPVSISTYQEPNRLRFLLSCTESDKGFRSFARQMQEQRQSGNLSDPRFLAIALVRKTFERVDLDMSHHTFTLVKTY